MRALGMIVVVVVAVACGGRAGEPPRPSRALSAEAVDVADHWDDGPCEHLEVTLRSGRVVDVSRAEVSDPACPAQTETVFILGDRTDMTYRSNNERRWVEDKSATGKDDGPGPLVLVGTLDGVPWLGVISSSYLDCWQFRFEKGEGAFHEDGALHLTSGLILPLAADFELPDHPQDPLPLRSDDAVCLNDRGEVVAVEIWIPY